VYKILARVPHFSHFLREVGILVVTSPDEIRDQPSEAAITLTEKGQKPHPFAFRAKGLGSTDPAAKFQSEQV
jgi:hypothetical protein